MNPTCTFLSLVLLAFCLLTANTNHVSAQEPAVADDSIDQEEREAPDDSEDADESEDQRNVANPRSKSAEAESNVPTSGTVDFGRVQLLNNGKDWKENRGLERQIETVEERGTIPTRS